MSHVFWNTYAEVLKERYRTSSEVEQDMILVGAVIPAVLDVAATIGDNVNIPIQYLTNVVIGKESPTSSLVSYIKKTSLELLENPEYNGFKAIEDSKP